MYTTQSSLSEEGTVNYCTIYPIQFQLLILVGERLASIVHSAFSLDRSSYFWTVLSQLFHGKRLLRCSDSLASSSLFIWCVSSSSVLGIRIRFSSVQFASNKVPLTHEQ